MNAKAVIERPRTQEQWQALLIDYGQRIKPLVDRAVRLYSIYTPKYIVQRGAIVGTEYPELVVKEVEFLQGQMEQIAKDMGLRPEVKS